MNYARSVSLPRETIEIANELIDHGLFRGLSDFAQEAMRYYIENHIKGSGVLHDEW